MTGDQSDQGRAGSDRKRQVRHLGVTLERQKHPDGGNSSMAAGRFVMRLFQVQYKGRV